MSTLSFSQAYAGGSEDCFLSLWPDKTGSTGIVGILAFFIPEFQVHNYWSPGKLKFK